ncbi:BPTI/Kunitz inhibitor domain-containing protein [Meloidogyne graminicola]|uniref:BPTI/Kunitz inhibitor domain-containing protein n=1 Tax=Meloidogyne graminicola TaxID=189291 RepID=A0A8S9ZRG4_9BILA|nr:BPTI/Kunitz inhibitor domain-containing protein [Meloidogyne graminicola]
MYFKLIKSLVKFLLFKLFLLINLNLCQDFKSRFVQDDFLPIPLSSPLKEAENGGGLKQDPRCLQEHDLGNGTKQIERFFFNAQNSSCNLFLYTGEGGNQNNFLTEIDCLNNCYIDVNEGAPLKEEDVHIIKQETDLGPITNCNENNNERVECNENNQSKGLKEKGELEKEEEQFSVI